MDANCNMIGRWKIITAGKFFICLFLCAGCILLSLTMGKWSASCKFKSKLFKYIFDLFLLRLFLIYSRWAICYHCKDMTKVDCKGLNVGVRQAVRILLLQVLGIIINVNYAILHPQLIVQVFRNAFHWVRVFPFMRERPYIYGQWK